MKNIKIFLLLLFVCMNITAQSDSLFNVYSSNTDKIQMDYLLQRLGKQFDNRREDVKESLKSKSSLLERQKDLRKWYKNILPIFPEKSPLNIIITKSKEYDDFTIEWVAYESQPNHHVTGLFYIPKKFNAPFPAVYIPCGHSIIGKGGETYQKAARLFARNGFIVLQADPISQGERFQYLDEIGQKITEERMLMHEILGQKLLLTGSNTVVHQLWDNIRGIDFLEQHPLVDKNKIALAGNSGGGTQVTYLVAFDDRIKVATPSCYIATTEKKFNTIGSQDGCQQLWGEGEIGIEEQDFLMLAAPKPIRILSAEQDFFHKDGAKIAFNELEKVYNVLGEENKIDQVFCDDKHGWHKPLREASVQWCKKWLMNDDSPVIEVEDTTIFKIDSSYQVTATGSVLTFFKNEKTVSDLTRERVIVSKKNRASYLRNISEETLKNKVIDLIGFEEPNYEVKYELVDKINIKGYDAEKYLITREKDSSFKLPAILLLPKAKQSVHNLTIIVSEFGKTSTLNDSIAFKELEQGRAVLTLDITNTGELKNNRLPKYDNKEFWIGKLPLYEGKSLLTYRAEDIIISCDFVQEIFNKQISTLNIISIGYTGPAALHAAFINEKINKIELKKSIRNWEYVANSDYLSDQLGNIVPDVLNYYDLPDLIKYMKSTKVEFK